MSVVDVGTDLDGTDFDAYIALHMVGIKRIYKKKKGKGDTVGSGRARNHGYNLLLLPR
jgi:hypothetical protein